MPFEIIRNDLTTMHVDAIVNAANTRPVIGSGVDAGIHKQAGPQLLAARQKIGKIPYGSAAITPAYSLNAKYVIHAASPSWFGKIQSKTALLESCYSNALQLALEYKCESIAFPLLSAGNHGFPKDLALQTAINVIGKFLLQYDMKVYLVVFNRDVYALSKRLFHSVQSFIDEHYIQEKLREEYICFESPRSIPPRSYDDRSGNNTSGSFSDSTQYSTGRSTCQPLHRYMELENQMTESDQEEPITLTYFPGFPRLSAPQAEPTASEPTDSSAARQTPLLCPLPKGPVHRSLQDLMKEVEESFSQSLIRLIDQKGMKDPDVYKRANVDRKLFSKIKNNPNYKPSKPTALAFAIALCLNLDETRDLIGRAGYAMTHSSKFDIIIEYFILEQNYNIFEINEVLFAFDQPLIGS